MASLGSSSGGVWYYRPPCQNHRPGPLFPKSTLFNSMYPIKAICSALCILSQKLTCFCDLGLRICRAFFYFCQWHLLPLGIWDDSVSMTEDSLSEGQSRGQMALLLIAYVWGSGCMCSTLKNTLTSSPVVFIQRWRWVYCCSSVQGYVGHFKGFTWICGCTKLWHQTSKQKMKKTTPTIDSEMYI